MAQHEAMKYEIDPDSDLDDCLLEQMIEGIKKALKHGMKDIAKNNCFTLERKNSRLTALDVVSNSHDQCMFSVL